MVEGLNTQSLKTFGTLKALIEDKSDDSRVCPTILLLHGYGANAKDLAFFSSMSSIKARWIFPQGPIQLDTMGQSFSWFPFDYEKWLYLSTRENQEILIHHKPEGMDSICDRILSLLDGFNFDYSKLVIGGFSQGSYMAVEILSRMKKKPKAIAIFSGVLMNKKNLMKNLYSCKDVHFFQSHGLSDQVLSFDLGKKLEALFRENQMSGTFEEFSGDHEIPYFILKKFENFIEKEFGLFDSKTSV